MEINILSCSHRKAERIRQIIYIYTYIKYLYDATFFVVWHVVVFLWENNLFYITFIPIVKWESSFQLLRYTRRYVNSGKNDKTNRPTAKCISPSPPGWLPNITWPSHSRKHLNRSTPPLTPPLSHNIIAITWGCEIKFWTVTFKTNSLG